jgi:hypothetical protein
VLLRGDLGAIVQPRLAWVAIQLNDPDERHDKGDYPQQVNETLPLHN